MSNHSHSLDRLAPISRRPKLTDINHAINFKDIATELDNLNLSIYTPSLYLHDSAKDTYTIDYDGEGLSINGREKGLRQLMATNLLKRLESSVNSFRLTLTRISQTITETINKIDNQEETIGDYRLEDVDYISWRRDLTADLEELKMLLLMLSDITPEHDSKLQMLIADLKEKFTHPINEGNKKILIFTAFADTADYLYKNLAERIKADCGLNVALITGSTEGKCTIYNHLCASV